jgi:hypothetical protein
MEFVQSPHRAPEEFKSWDPPVSAEPRRGMNDFDWIDSRNRYQRLFSLPPSRLSATPVI